MALRERVGKDAIENLIRVYLLSFILTETRGSRLGLYTERRSPSFILIHRLALYPLFFEIMMTSLKSL